MIKIAKEINKAEQPAIDIPILGLINEKVLDVFDGPNPNKISEITNNTFLLFNGFHFFYNSHYQF